MVPQRELIAALDAGYALAVQTVELLPVGNDATAAVYRVFGHTQGKPTQTPQRYFLKVKQGAPTEASLSVPAYLHANDLSAVVAPLSTTSGELAWAAGHYTLILYPFIVGKTGMDSGLTSAEWTAFGRLMQAWHAHGLPPTQLAQLPRERFHSPHLATVVQLERLIAHTHLNAPQQQALVRFWQEKQSEIRAICRRLRTLGEHLRQASLPLVLCHADIHTANLLIKPDGTLAVIDWDGVMLAPKERDLIFIMARAKVQFPAERAFFQGYGGVTVDPLAFAYYRYEWVVQEIADYGSRLLLPNRQDEQDDDGTSSAAAVAAFQQLFQVDDVIAVAYATEQDLPDNLCA